MNKFRNAAIKVLEESKEPLHYKEITKRALEKGILHTEGKTPEASMNAQIVTEINSKGEFSTFIRTAPATFDLNPNKPENEPVNEIIKEKRGDKIGSGFIGKAGEHFVTSELLLRGFNASIMSVDVGMDVIATKNNRLFSLQVKTANLSPTNTYEYDVRKVALQREDYAGNVFYIFVMIEGEGNKSSLILPSTKIEELVHNKSLVDIKKHDKFRVTLKVRNDEIFIRNLDNPIDYFWDNWDIIK